MASIGEVIRRLERIEDKIDNGVFVRSDLLAEKESAAAIRTGALGERVAHLEEWQTWATRALIGAGIGIMVEAIILAFSFSRVLVR